MTFSRRTDLLLLSTTLVLVTFGLVMIYSTSAVMAQEHYSDSLHFLKRQALWAVLGIVAMWGMRYMPYRAQRRLSGPAVMCALGLLAVVLVVGKTVGGAQRWLIMGPLTMQPSEIAKYVLVVYIARLLSQNPEHLSSFTRGYLPSMLLVGVFTLLVFAQPDLGTAVIMVATASLQLLIAGIPLRFLGYTALAGLPGLYWALFHVRFRLTRIASFLFPELDPQGSGYQLRQALLALGMGGFFGAGLGQGQQKFFYLPQAHTDFIFAVLGEELGFVGAAVLVLLFVVLLWRILRIAVACQEPFGTALGLGIFALFAIQITINLGVVLGLMPTKGLPLPLVSLGGSSLLLSLMAIGTMLNIAEATGRGTQDMRE
jgi:cell division protein FtsW